MIFYKLLNYNTIVYPVCVGTKEQLSPHELCVILFVDFKNRFSYNVFERLFLNTFLDVQKSKCLLCFINATVLGGKSVALPPHIL